MSRDTINIIGAGIAGLTAGCFGQLNGYRTRIFEAGSKPGGLCTSWQRGDYLIDGCLHWLVGTRPGSTLHQLWHELGALAGREMITHPEFLEVRDADGQRMTLYTDLDRLEAHLRELSPGDGAAIDALLAPTRRLCAFRSDLVTTDLLQRYRAVRDVIPLTRLLWRHSRTPVRSLVSRFRDPFLRQAFGMIFALPDSPLVSLLVTMAWRANGNAAYPVGGSLDFARAIARRYLELGGEVHYGRRVNEVLVSGDRTAGLRLEDGSEVQGDHAISAADGRTTIFELLGGRHTSRKIRECYRRRPRWPSQVQVSLGVARDVADQPNTVFQVLPRPRRLAGADQERLCVKHHAFDPVYAPAGKSVVQVCLRTEWGHWRELGRDRAAYDAEKSAVGEATIDLLEQYHPGIRADVEVTDVATPLTYERQTGNWEGSLQGWLCTTDNVLSRMPRTLPGLAGFQMAGHWVTNGGGLPVAATSGFEAIRRICKADRRRFVTGAGSAPTEETG